MVSGRCTRALPPGHSLLAPRSPPPLLAWPVHDRQVASNSRRQGDVTYTVESKEAATYLAGGGGGAAAAEEGRAGKAPKAARGKQRMASRAMSQQASTMLHGASTALIDEQVRIRAGLGGSLVCVWR